MIGQRIRRLFGPLEGPVARLYRAVFFDLDSLARAARGWTDAKAILEVGCGEGLSTERFARAFPGAQITGIDETPNVGRLFRGDRSRVTFLRSTLGDFVGRHAGSFDLVVVCDVLHHVPWEDHGTFLSTCGAALQPGGRFVLKDWERRPNAIHALAYASDRWVTGDRVRNPTAAELGETVRRAFGLGSVDRELTLPPWPNNLAFFIRTGAGDSPTPRSKDPTPG